MKWDWAEQGKNFRKTQRSYFVISVDKVSIRIQPFPLNNKVNINGILVRTIFSKTEYMIWIVVNDDETATNPPLKP